MAYVPHKSNRKEIVKALGRLISFHRDFVYDEIPAVRHASLSLFVIEYGVELLFRFILWIECEGKCADCGSVPSSGIYLQQICVIQEDDVSLSDEGRMI